ncbi:MAG: transcription termination/antitermination protein NusG [bacterium]
MAKNWYVLHTYSGYEMKVKANLEHRLETMGMTDKVGKILIPTEEVAEIKKGKKEITVKKAFPGYILIEMEMDEESWYVIRNTPGVMGFVGAGAKPIPLEENEAKGIIDKVEREKSKPRAEIPFKKNDTIKVTNGPFVGFSGVIKEIHPERGKVKVMVTIFGRSTSVELDFLQIERA